MFRWREGVGGYKPLEAVEVLSIRGKDLMIHSSPSWRPWQLLLIPRMCHFNSSSRSLELLEHKGLHKINVFVCVKVQELSMKVGYKWL